MDIRSIITTTTYNVREVIAGRGKLGNLTSIATQRFGSRGFIVTGKHTSIPSDWQRSTSDEPTTDEVDQLRAVIAHANPNWVAAIGGGSVLDLAKAATGLSHLPKPTAHYQIHPEELTASQIPFVATPTTAGTGSEATLVSVLTNPTTSLKASIRHPSWLPQLVILDSETMFGTPRHVIVHSGLDAYTQAYESLVSRYATPATQAYSRLGLATVRRALPQLASGDFTPAQQLLEASYLIGTAFAQARLGVVHGLAHPLGARYHIPHGACCAACLPAVVRYNQLYQLDLSLLDEVNFVNPFKGLLLQNEEQIIAETLASGSTKANPRDVTADDVKNLLLSVFKE